MLHTPLANLHAAIWAEASKIKDGGPAHIADLSIGFFVPVDHRKPAEPIGIPAFQIVPQAALIVQ